jgi:dTDP-L-rhamnose 4-epimerase
MRVLVTGGAGFIGSHLVDHLLARGDDVRVLDVLDPQVHDGWPDYLASDAERIHGDVRDPDVVGRALDGVDRVVHFAAAVGVGQSMYEIAHYTSVNALGAAVVLEQATAVRDRIEKIVVASSMSIYGEGLYRCPIEEVEVLPRRRPESQLEARHWEHVCPSCGAELVPQPTPETKPLFPTSIYAIGKRDHEEMVLVWGDAYRVPATALRFFNAYGPRQALSNPYTGVAAIFASRLLNGRGPIVFEDGLQSRDFVQVTDVARAVATALEPGRGDGASINVGSGVGTSVLGVASALGEALGTEVEPEVRSQYRAGDIRHCFADTSRASELLGFTPAVELADGFRELGAWLVDQPAEDRAGEASEELVRRGLTR